MLALLALLAMVILIQWIGLKMLRNQGRRGGSSRIVGKHVGCRVYNSVSQSVNNTTLTKLNFDSVRYSDGGTFWVVGNPTRITVPITGVYMIGHCFEFSGNADGRTRYADLYVNNTIVIGEHSGSGYGASGNPADTTLLSIACPWKMNAGDYVEVRVYQNSGSTLSTTASTLNNANNNEVWCELISI